MKKRIIFLFLCAFLTAGCNAIKEKENLTDLSAEQTVQTAYEALIAEDYPTYEQYIDYSPLKPFHITKKQYIQTTKKFTKDNHIERKSFSLGEIKKLDENRTIVIVFIQAIANGSPYNMTDYVLVVNHQGRWKIDPTGIVKSYSIKPSLDGQLVTLSNVKAYATAEGSINIQCTLQNRLENAHVYVGLTDQAFAILRTDQGSYQAVLKNEKLAPLDHYKNYTISFTEADGTPSSIELHQLYQSQPNTDVVQLPSQPVRETFQLQ